MAESDENNVLHHLERNMAVGNKCQCGPMIVFQDGVLMFT